ncbi:LytR/AlgR family response regulator transcription factor [Marinifilum caeruleilacunae]|uniref:Response regulator transcription factor n=1 Tax=Marinifilum caeruleilacunae TaxID=2499076 RepID=A0ABX1WZ59_9BACT|nr:LytTR family DNA-binding domain-containing protein [Marinifilum caeruleilacunae]NOU61407.1 response regulator transcription factor [Marinifilum caeruleilacunae]
MKTKYRSLIIDDEQLARQRLVNLLLPHADRIEIIGEAANGSEAIELINRLEPDLIFLDIQMPEKSGFDILKELKHQPLIIFCTAHDEYALMAFETVSIDYLLKPIKKERLQKAIDKLHLIGKENDVRKLENMLAKQIQSLGKKEISTIPVKTGDRVAFVSIEDITHFKAEDKYVNIYKSDGKEFIVDHSLSYLSEKLDSNFLRIQRSYIVNINYIKEIKRYLGGRYIFLLHDSQKTKIISGKNYHDQIKGLMNF